MESAKNNTNEKDINETNKLDNKESIKEKSDSNNLTDPQNQITANKNEDEIQILKEYKSNLNSLIDFSLLNKYFENFSNKDSQIIPKKIEVFKEKSLHILNKKINAFKERINSKFSKLREKIESKFRDLETNFNQAEERMGINNIENFNNITVEELTAFFDKNNKSQKDLENMIYLVKKNSDQEKIKNNLEDIETILYSKMISSGQGFEFAEPSTEKFLKDTKNHCSELNRDLEITIPTPSIQRIKKNNFITNPLKMKFRKDISDKLQKNYTIDSVFCAFTTYDGISYVAWGSPSYTLDIYDLMQNKIIKSIAGFNSHIHITRHFFDKISKKDYLLTTTLSKSCKIFDCKDFSNILTLKDCHNSTYMYSGLIIFDNLSPKDPFIVTSAPNEDLKVWNFDKKVVNTINTKKDYTYFLNVWYDDRNNENKIFIINANGKDVKIYNYRTGELYKTFLTSEPGTSSIWHMSACMKIIEEKPHLFESDGNGNFNIWDIDTGLVKKKTSIKNCCLRGICIWNDEYVIVAASDKCVKVINYNTGIVEGQIEGHVNVVCTVTKILHPVLGESILTGGIDGKIKLYSIEENK